MNRSTYSACTTCWSTMLFTSGPEHTFFLIANFQNARLLEANLRMARIISLRHIAIKSKRTGLSWGMRRLNTAEKISRSARVGAAYQPRVTRRHCRLLSRSPSSRPGFTSWSESKVETDAEVEVLESNAK